MRGKDVGSHFLSLWNSNHVLSIIGIGHIVSNTVNILYNNLINKMIFAYGTQT